MEEIKGWTKNVISRSSGFMSEKNNSLWILFCMHLRFYNTLKEKGENLLICLWSMMKWCDTEWVYIVEYKLTLPHSSRLVLSYLTLPYQPHQPATLFSIGAVCYSSGLSSPPLTELLICNNSKLQYLVSKHTVFICVSAVIPGWYMNKCPWERDRPLFLPVFFTCSSGRRLVFISFGCVCVL